MDWIAPTEKADETGRLCRLNLAVHSLEGAKGCPGTLTGCAW